MRDALESRLRSLKVVLGVDSPQVRGWAPVVRQEAQSTVNAAITEIAALRKRAEEAEAEASELRALLRTATEERERAKAQLAACMASRDALRDWAQECRDQVLYLLAQRNDELGRLADGLGQASVGLLGPNAAGNRLARQGQSELTGLLGPGSEA